jgi:hypothetical protein
MDMSQPVNFSIKRISVEEQHELFLKEIKELKKENENLKKIIMRLTFQNMGVTKPFINTTIPSELNESWEQVDP